jgi:acyl carrier protein/NAD(P)-dependent dehydrogenase (short-subunit alcohol dehydrogenase family)
MVAQWMVAQGARHLVLIGRSKPSSEVADLLERLRSTGVQVQVMQADVSSREEMSTVLNQVRKQLPPLRGIIHSAAVLHDGILLNLKPEDFPPVLAPKIAGAWNLHKLTVGENLKFFILFSAGASLLGAPGQGNYAGANSFLDGLAAYRHQQGLPVLSINWGPWAEVGLAAAQANRGERMALRGFINIMPEQGLAALEQLIRYGDAITQIGVIPLNLRQLQQTYPTLTQAPLLMHIVTNWQEKVMAKSSETALRRDLLACKQEERQQLLETHLQAQIASVLRIAPSRIDPQTALNTLGVDSLMSLEIRNCLEDSTGLTLQATLLWAHPTIAALVEHIAQKMDIPLKTILEVENVESVKMQEEDSIVEEVSNLSDDAVKNSLDMELDDLPVEFLR